MNEDNKEHSSEQLPESLKQRGITRVVSNLGEDQMVVLPEGLITTLFKEALLKKLTQK